MTNPVNVPSLYYVYIQTIPLLLNVIILHFSHDRSNWSSQAFSSTKLETFQLFLIYSPNCPSFSTTHSYAPNVAFQHHTQPCGECGISAPHTAMRRMWHFSTTHSYAPNVAFQHHTQLCAECGISLVSSLHFRPISWWQKVFMLNGTLANTILGTSCLKIWIWSCLTDTRHLCSSSQHSVLDSALMTAFLWQITRTCFRRMRTNITIFSTVMTSLQKCPLWPSLTVGSALRCVAQDRRFNSKFYKTVHYQWSRIVLAKQTIQSVSSFQQTEKKLKTFIPMNQPTRCSNFSGLLLVV